jgi:hypothetical protein
MRLFTLGAVVAGSCLVAVSRPFADPLPSYSALEARPVHVAAPGHPPELLSVPQPATLTEVVQQYCVVCHNDQLLRGNLSLQSFDVERAAEQAETAEKMIRKLRAGMMPPPGIPRPAGDTLVALVETLESVVDGAARIVPTLGERRFQRLSRAEYERVVHELLALDVDANKWLPPDLRMGAFDNQSAAQPFSPTLLDSFLRAAAEVTRLAIGNPSSASTTTKHVNDARLSQHAWDLLEGAPFGSRGGMVVTQNFPADGEYIFGLQVSGGSGNQTAIEDVDISVDGQPVALIKLEHNGEAGVDILTEPIFVRGGEHRVSAAFVKVIDGPYEDRFRPSAWSSAGTAGSNYGITELTHLTELWITGPQTTTGMSETESRQKVFTCRPMSVAEARPCAESILARLATQAFRGPVSAEDMADLMNLYDHGAASDGFEIGVRAGLQAILVSPEFLFRLEREPTESRPGEAYRLSDMDLATRLSFFLWASAPDQELLDVAASGRLSGPAVLEQQVRRMLEDPRSTLASSFVYQWLRLTDVGRVLPEPFYYPDFSRQLADAMVQETELLFQHLVQEDRSLLELLNADYTFLNSRLAAHYEIEGVSGDEFRRVQYPDDRRSGIFGHGSILQLTSMPSRTSPVLRGKWVMEVLMGTPPPPPPPDVPAFEASPDAIGTRVLTTRQRMEIHRSAPVCNSCHRFIDPIGLALDNFDATGRWRTRENMMPLDTRGALYDGTPLSRPADLAAALLKRPIPLVRNFTDNLLAYAIGRPAEYYDQPTVRAIARAAEANDYKMSAFVMGIVKSDLFQKRQVQTTAN